MNRNSTQCLLFSFVLMNTILLSSSFPIVKRFTSLNKKLLYPQHHQQEQQQRKKFELYAKKKTNSKAPAAAGFGSSSNTKKKGSKSKSSSVKNKTRVVSGHTGSGTKPLREAANTFDKLRQTHGPESCHDLYVRSPSNDETLFWFVGKIARCLDESQLNGSVIPTAKEAVICQKRLILEYASLQLRPQNLGGPYKQTLEIWTAPGDSEMDAVQNKINLEKITGSAKDIREEFSIKDVGFNPEIYVGDEIDKGGLRIVRDENGLPVKPVFSINDGV